LALVIAGGVEGELSEEFSCLSVDDPDGEAFDKDDRD